MKKSERQKAKNRAWHWFSKYIKLRDSLATTFSKSECLCVTCMARVSGAKLHAGHAIAGRNDSILTDEEIVNGQCEFCNRPQSRGGMGGNYGAYSVWFINKYGLKRWEEKVRLSNEIKKYTPEEWREIADHYRQKYHELDTKS